MIISISKYRREWEFPTLLFVTLLMILQQLIKFTKGESFIMNNLEEYEINNEYTITELLSHFDSNIILDIMKDKLENTTYSALGNTNIVASFEENFKMMKERFIGDDQNIQIVRNRVYADIISIICEKFQINFEFRDDTINLYTAAFYAYDFFVANFYPIMVRFFTSFIINNKDSLYTSLNLDGSRKNKDSSTLYNKKFYTDPKYITISANLEKVLHFISGIHVELGNIFQSTYTNIAIVDFLNNAFADKNDFFRNFYCSMIYKPELVPILITDIRLQLQKLTGNIAEMDISHYIKKEEE